MKTFFPGFGSETPVGWRMKWSGWTSPLLMAVSTAESDASDGLYTVSAFFTMPGEWEVMVDIDPEGANESLSFIVEAFTE